MKNFTASLIVLFLCSVGHSGHAANSSTQIEINQLLQNENAYLGKMLSIHSCLVMSPHGAFIQPCGNADWRRIINLDLSGPIDGLIPSTFFDRLHTNYSSEVEANVTGTLAPKEVADYSGKPRVIYVLRLKNISNPKIFRKF